MKKIYTLRFPFFCCSISFNVKKNPQKNLLMYCWYDVDAVLPRVELKLVCDKLVEDVP